MDKRGNIITGFSIIAILMTGIASFIVAIFAFFNGDWITTGITFIASGLAFGLLLNAMLRQ